MASLEFPTVPFGCSNRRYAADSRLVSVLGLFSWMRRPEEPRYGGFPSGPWEVSSFNPPLELNKQGLAIADRQRSKKIAREAHEEVRAITIQ